MFNRLSLSELVKWKDRQNRKPLIIRGARQIGKTTLARQLGEKFANVVSLNLELSADRALWNNEPAIDELIRAIEITKKTKIIPGQTLIFIDEIQFQPAAVQSLRYFYEKMPDLHVIATGSLLEVALKNRGFSFPVGRVEFLYLYPATFEEFLGAMSHKALADELGSIAWNHKIPEAVHDFACALFNEYAFIGGMPEVIQRYAEEKSYLSLPALKESLMVSFEEDVPKYGTPAQTPYVQLLIRQSPLFAGQRIQYENFAGSGYRSREMKHAFELLEKAMVVGRVMGSPSATPPQQPNLRVAPKILFLDVGLVCHRMGVDPANIKRQILSDLFRGSIAEQIVGQEILALNRMARTPLHFWYRNKPGATAEVDFTVTCAGHIIPIEVKSGKTGKLKSLFQFVEESSHPYAVRIYSGPLRSDSLQTAAGKPFQLLSVPFYLTHQLPRLLSGWIIK